MLKKMRKKAGALLVMICLGVIILLCWEAGEHLKDKILRSLETAAEARTGKPPMEDVYAKLAEAETDIRTGMVSDAMEGLRMLRDKYGL